MIKNYEELKQSVNAKHSFLLNFIGDSIKRKRKELNISIRTLSLRTGVSSTTITELENARSLPKIRAILTLYTCLGINDGVLSVNITTNDTIEDKLKCEGLGEIEVKEVLNFIEFQKNRLSKRK